MFKRFILRGLVRDVNDGTGDGGGGASETQMDMMAELLPADQSPEPDQEEEEQQEEVGQEQEQEQEEQQQEDQKEDKTDETAELRKTISEMAALIESLRSGTPTAPTTTEQQPQQAWPAQTPEQQTQVQTATKIEPYLSEQELDQIIDNPALILTAIQRGQQDVVNQIASNLPQVVSQLVNQQVAMQSAVTEFYTTNADLRPHADYVRYIVRDIETKHKDKTFAEIFQMAADESRKKLGLQAHNQAGQQRDRQQPSKEKQKPAFAGSRRQGTQRPAGKSQEFFDTEAAGMFP